MITWHYITSAAFKAADDAVKTSDKLFFLSDTKQIYRGTENFTESVILYTELPTTPAVGKLYIDSTTLEGKMYNGTTWTTVIEPVQSTLTSTDTKKPVSGKAVADFVNQAIKDVTGSDGLVKDVSFKSLAKASDDASYETLTLGYTMADGTEKTTTIELGYDLKLTANEDGTTTKLNIVTDDGKTIGAGVDLDLERFVHSGEYDSKTKKIILYFNDAKTDKVEIPASALVDIYTGGSTNTVLVSVSEDNVITADAKKSAVVGNTLEIKPDGLYVPATDISGKMDKDTDATKDNVAVFDTSGNAVDGGIALEALATDAEVAAIKEGLETDISGKMDKVANTAKDQIIVAAADGNASASGKKLGAATFAAAPDGNTVATEAGVAAYSVAKTSVVTAIADTDASADKVASEKAVADSLTWKTTI